MNKILNEILDEFLSEILDVYLREEAVLSHPTFTDTMLCYGPQVPKTKISPLLVRKLHKNFNEMKENTGQCMLADL